MFLLSYIDVFLSFSFFAVILFIWLAKEKESPNNTILFIILFFLFILIELISMEASFLQVPKDSISYFEAASEIAESGFNENVIYDKIKPGISNWGVNIYTLIEAVLVYVFFPNYSFLHIFNIFLVVITIFYSTRICRLLFGYGCFKYVLLGYLIYFALYWHVLQNLREAPLLFFMILGLLHYILWWKYGNSKNKALAIVFGICSILFRPENVLLFIAIISLTSLLKRKTTYKKIVSLFIIILPLIFIAIHLSFQFTGNDILRAINASRSIRQAGMGGYQLTDENFSSYTELILEFPTTLRFFYLPLLPWEISTGLIYFKAYIHSLSTLILLIFSIVGFKRIHFNLKFNNVKKKLIILFISFIFMSILYSFADIGAGSSSRHSTFFFFLLLSTYFPYGAKYFFEKLLINKNKIFIPPIK